MRSRRDSVRVMTALACAGLFAGCGNKPSNLSPASADALTASAVTLKVPLPPGVALSSVALAANAQIIVGNNVSIGEENSSVGLPFVVNAGTGSLSTTQTGVTLTANLWSVGNVFLATGTTVSGAVTTGGTVTEQTGVTVAGTVLQHQSLAPVATSMNVTFPGSTATINLAPGQTSTVGPGAFSSVTVNSRAVLTLQSGTYYLGTLDIEPQGQIALSGPGPFVLNVQSSVNLKGQISLPSGEIAPSLTLIDAGTSDVYLQYQFDGALIAPNANLTIAPNGTTTTYHGTFVGKSVTIQPGVTLLHRGTVAGSVVPVAECVVPGANGTFQAVFGYSASTLNGPESIPVGPDNMFEPSPTSQGQPTTFNPGRQTAQFAVTFSGKAPVTWVLNGFAATANMALPRCNASCVQHLTSPPAGRITTVLPTPAPQLSVEESNVMRDSFRWRDTLPVPEANTDGTPRLYYGLIYLGSADNVTILDAFRINYSASPLFDTEMTALDAAHISPYTYPFDTQGQFAYALFPGKTYNAIRNLALDPTQPIQLSRAIPLRPIPTTDVGYSAQTTCGLAPVAQCVAQAADGSLRAVFSYSNPEGQPVTIPIGSSNALAGGSSALQPEAFNTGTHTAVFAVPLPSGFTVSWTLNGVTVSENSSTPRCSTTITNSIGVDKYNPFPAPAPTQCRSESPNEALYPSSHLPPAARQNTCVSLAYRFAETLGFQWRGVASDADDTAGQAADAALALADTAGAHSSFAPVAAGSTQVVKSALFGKIFRKIVQGAASIGKGAVDDIRRGLNAGVGFFAGSTNVIVNVVPTNTDPTLNNTDELQAWGKDRKSPISLQGLELRSQSSVFLSLANLDSNNQGIVKVINGLHPRICFSATNGAAHIVTGILNADVCTQTSIGTSPSPVTVKPQLPFVNMMAQFTDGQKYAKNVANLSIAQAEVAAGTVSEWIGAINKNAPFTPCLSFSWYNDVELLAPIIGLVAADHVNSLDGPYIRRAAQTVTNTYNRAVQAFTQAQNSLIQAFGPAPQDQQTQTIMNALASAISTSQAAQNQSQLLENNADDAISAQTTAGTLGLDGDPNAGAANMMAQNAAVALSASAAPTSSASTAASSSASALSMAVASGTATAAPGTPQAIEFAAVATLINPVIGPVVGAAAIIADVLPSVTAFTTQVAGVAIAELLALPAGETFEFLAGGDIVAIGGSNQDNFTDRAIYTHEYGHYVLCNLLRDGSPFEFAKVYDTAAAEGIVDTGDPTATASLLNESFADLFASQVAGATNYASPPNSIRSVGKASGNLIQMNYCQAAPTSNTPDDGKTSILGLKNPPGLCMETNQTAVYDSSTGTDNPGSAQDFDTMVLRNVSMITDVLDENGAGDVPTSGAQWAASSSGVTLSSFAGAAGNDDVVAASGQLYWAWILHFLNRDASLDDENAFFGGLSDAMADQGVNWCARCNIFQLHTTDKSTGMPVCPVQWVGPRPTFTLNGTTMPLTCSFDPGGCPAGMPADPNTQVCDPPCPPGQVFDPVMLVCVQQIGIP